MSEVDERILEGFPRGVWGIAGAVSSVEGRHEVHLRRESHPSHLPRLYLSESEHKDILQKSPSQIRQLILYHH